MQILIFMLPERLLILLGRKISGDATAAELAELDLQGIVILDPVEVIRYAGRGPSEAAEAPR